MLVVAGGIVYDTLTGRVSGRAGASYARKEHPILFWVMTPVMLCFAALLFAVAFHDLYHRAFT